MRSRIFCFFYFRGYNSFLPFALLSGNDRERAQRNANDVGLKSEGGRRCRDGFFLFPLLQKNCVWRVCVLYTEVGYTPRYKGGEEIRTLIQFSPWPGNGAGGIGLADIHVGPNGGQRGESENRPVMAGQAVLAQ